MTIAAGFKCKDGVVLCSDTQITQAAGKSYESKIYRINPNADCFLVYAGDVSLIKEFTAELKEITANVQGRDLTKLIRKHYRRFHDKFYTQAPKLEKAFSVIIFTVRVNDTVLLYAGNGRHFYPVDNYICLGTGAPVAEPFFGPLEFAKITTMQASHLAIYTLSKIKDYADAVGGKTNVFGVFNETVASPPSDYEWEDAEVKAAEEGYRYLEEQLRPLILDLPSLSPRQVATLWRSIGSNLKKNTAAVWKKRFRK